MTDKHRVRLRATQYQTTLALALTLIVITEWPWYYLAPLLIGIHFASYVVAEITVSYAD